MKKGTILGSTLLVLIFAITIWSAPPVFLNHPRINMTAANMHSGFSFCGITQNGTEDFMWELYNDNTSTWVPKVNSSCIEVPHGFNITSESDLPPNNCVKFRFCATNNDGTTCALESFFILDPELK